MPAFPYSVATGAYTADQLDGFDCGKCGKPFAVGETSRPFERVNGQQIFAHVECPKAGALR